MSVFRPGRGYFWQTLWRALLLLCFGAGLLPLGAQESLHPWLEVLRDPLAEIPADQPEAAEARSDWRGLAAHRESLGFLPGAVWARVQRRDLEPGAYLVELAAPNLHSLDLWSGSGEEAGPRRHWQTGLLRPWASRPLPHRHFVFPVTVGSEGRLNLTLRAAGRDQIVLPLKLWTPEAFHEASRVEYALFGLFFGLILTIVLFQTLVAYTVKDPGALWYAAFCFSLGLLLFSISGLLPQALSSALDLWPWLKLGHPGLAGAVLVLGLEFANSFLESAEQAPGWLRVKRILQLGGISLIGLLHLWDYALALQAALGLLLGGVALMAADGIAAWRRGQDTSRIYLAAWSVLLLAAGVYLLAQLGLLPLNQATRSLLLVGTGVHALLMTVALADRYRRAQNLAQRIKEVAIRSQQELQRSAEENLFRDNLTGFPNRRQLLKDLEGLQGGGSLLLGNLNSFGEVNSFYGQNVGDLLLRALALRLEEACRGWNSLLYKLRGDEFAVLFPGVLDEMAFESRAREVATLVSSRSFRFDVHSLDLTVTLGGARGFDDLLVKAGAALAAAKQDRRPWQLTAPKVLPHERHAENLAKVQMLRSALQENRIEVHYQPLFDNSSGVIAKYEALMRLRLPDGTVLGPGHFLEAAYRSRLYPALSRHLMGLVFKDLERLPAGVSINIAIEDLTSPPTRDLIRRELARHEAGRVTFEILETAAVGDYSLLHEFIREVKALGAHIAIDDFGTGYSNFNHILSLNVDVIKIDGSLIKTLDADPHSCILVENIVDFCRKLGIATVAEFVHSGPIYEVVRTLGIRYSQGYFLGPPRAEFGGDPLAAPGSSAALTAG